MNTTATKLNFEQYNEELGRGAPSEIRLHAMLRQLEKDKKAYPHEYEICSVMGVALVMLGKFEQALKVLKASFRMGKQLNDAMNIIFAYNCLKQYGEAMGFVLENRDSMPDSIKLFAIVLSGQYNDISLSELDKDVANIIRAAMKYNLTKELTNMMRHLIHFAPSNTLFNFSVGIEEGEIVFDIEMIINASIDEAVDVSLNLSKLLVDRFDDRTLMHIVPNVYMNSSNEAA